MGKPVNKTLRIAAMSAGEEIGHVSGPIVTFRGNGDPLRSLVVNIEPVQDLHGYDSPWPAGGGKNKFAIGDAVGILASIGASYGLTTTLDATNETVRITGTPTWGDTEATVNFRIISCRSGSYYGNAPATHDYTGMVGKPFVVNKSSNVTAVTKISINNDGTLGVGLTKTNNAAVDITFRIAIEASGSTITAWTPYSNLCPISGWSAVNVWVKPTYDPTANPTATLQLGQTVYGGTLDVTNGVLTVNREMVTFDGSNDEAWNDYSNYNGYYIQLNAMKSGNRQDGWSNMLKDSKTSAQGQIGAMWLGVNNSKNFFVIGVHDTMGATLSVFRSYLSEHPLELVYPLATPITIPLTPTEISTLQGQNNLWADTGDVDVEYIATGGEGGKLALLLRNRKELLIALRKGLTPAEAGLLNSTPLLGEFVRPGLSTDDEKEEDELW